MIVAQALTKCYGDKKAVDELSFTVRPGQVTGFLGPNGAGKSTTMRMIIGLDRPTGGRVSVGGRSYRSRRRRVSRRLEWTRCWLWSVWSRRPVAGRVAFPSV
jgi:ABC-type multidrug transport system ATPase subunit